MWKTYSVKYLKNNKAVSIFIIAVAFISSMLLSFVSVFFYNLWTDYKYRMFVLNKSSNDQLTPIFFAYLFLLMAASISLILMLHNAFEVTMNTRLHQLGILQSVGATPKQIKSVLINETAALSLIPLIAGNIVGLGLCFLFLKFLFALGDSFRTYHIDFQYHPIILACSLLFSFLTIGISAWIPAKSLSKMTPLEAIHYGAEPPVKQMKQFHFITSLFGIYGELARKSIYARKKAFRTSALSITFSFLAFISFLNLETISGISTQRTYFERYRDKWDFFITLDKEKAAQAALLKKIIKIEGIKNCISYKKFTAYAYLTEDMFSKELSEIGITKLNKDIKIASNGSYRIEVPIFILDNSSFQNYRSRVSTKSSQQKEEVIAVNMIWDSVNSNRAARNYIPFLDTKKPIALNLQNEAASEKDTLPITISSFTDSLPEWKEEFQQYSFTLIASEHFYESLKKHFSWDKTYFNIKLKTDSNHTAIADKLETFIKEMPNTILESRLEQEQTENSIRSALRIVIGAFAGLFSCIGLSNVFSATLGHIYQRKKEFARYLSMGLSPRGMKKILFTEALIISLRPAVFSLFVNLPLILFALNISNITLFEFLANAPFLPILIFIFFILSFVGLAYYLGARKICSDTIIETLRDDTML